MVTLENTAVDQFTEEGFEIVNGLLNPEEDLQPVIEEYSEHLDLLARSWHKEGKISDSFDGCSFSEKIIHIIKEFGPGCLKYLDISLPQRDIRKDSPMFHGPNTFNLLTNSKLLDAVENFIGPEIYSNPVQHIRIKAPEIYLPQDMRGAQASAKNPGASLVAQTFWHQDLGVVEKDADDSLMLTVWIPMTKAIEENGCLRVAPKSHKNGLQHHCFTPTQIGLSEEQVGPTQKALPMNPGDVLFMTKTTMHSSLPNLSNSIRWSFDLRYNPIGHPTGRKWFPGFVARSASNPETELRNPTAWSEMWKEARLKLSRGETPTFRRWNPDDPYCA